MTRPRFTIQLEYAGTGDAIKAIRWALKFLWRSADLKCINIVEAGPDAPSAEEAGVTK